MRAFPKSKQNNNVFRIEDHEEYSRAKFTGYSEDDKAEWIRDAEDHFNGEICGALTKNRKMCRSTPMENGRCRLHGGSSPNGLDHPRTKHGSYSKYLPERILDKYEEATKNSEVLTLRNEIGLITSRLYELAEKVEEAGGKQKYERLIYTYERWQKAERNDLKNKHMAKDNFEDVLEDIKKDLGIWDEIDSLVDTKRKLVDSEQRKMNNLSQFIPAERVTMLMGALMKIVVDEIKDLEGMLIDGKQIEKSLRSIAQKFRNTSNKGGEQF